MNIDRGVVARLAVGVAMSVALAVAVACHPAGADAPAATAVKTSAPGGVPAASLERGRTLYKANCAACHGDQGHGDGPAAAAFNPKPRNHADAAAMSQLTDEDIAKVIQFGGAIKNMPMMPSNPALKGADLQAVVAYTRSLSRH
jgi:mono/diheme cytochrome c family protein